jgi:hypothetical protein
VLLNVFTAQALDLFSKFLLGFVSGFIEFDGCLAALKFMPD